jgi:hypothetical protein
MILTAHQPQYLPYPGYFHKMLKADVFVFLNQVQYIRSEWQNRNRLRNKDGWQWIILPVMASYPSRIWEVQLLQSGWPVGHWRTITQLYARSKYLKRLDGLKQRYESMANGFRDNRWLHEVNERTTTEMAEMLGITTYLAYEGILHLTEEETATPDMRLISLCKRMNCDSYLAGPGGRNYMNLDVWKAHGIEVIWQDFHLKPYEQLWPGWVENLSTLDLILCVENPFEYIS